jgi:hypothetical protein
MKDIRSDPMGPYTQSFRGCSWGSQLESRWPRSRGSLHWSALRQQMRASRKPQPGLVAETRVALYGAWRPLPSAVPADTANPARLQAAARLETTSVSPHEKYTENELLKARDGGAGRITRFSCCSASKIEASMNKTRRTMVQLNNGIV